MNDAKIYNMDCIPGMAEHLADESIDLFVSSIPFGALFMYSGKPQDIGNNQDGVDMEAGQFGLHMRFFIEQVYRVMKPGRNVCIHIQQLLRYVNQHGYMGRRDFRGAVVEMFSQGGLEWTGEVVIPKNPQAMAQRLSLHSLMFITGKTNSTKLAPAVNDYVMIFQKPGDAVPPVKALRCSELNPTGWVTSDEWIAWASGVWGDIRETDILDGWKAARGSDEEKHVCPLQLEVIRRCIKLYTNPGETVLDSFMGIGSTAYVAIEQGRNAVGFELHDNYHVQALRNVEKIKAKIADEKSTDLFAAMGVEGEV